ncbi:MAG: hypothetical protein SNJ52_01315 [Verrucomicrobiia bacterium]
MIVFSTCLGSVAAQRLLQTLPEDLASLLETVAFLGGLWGFFLLARAIAGSLLGQKKSATHPTATSAIPGAKSVAASKNEPTAAAPASPPEVAGLPAPLFAAIAATCHLVLNRPHRILAVEYMGGADQWSGLDLRSWSREGRRDIFTSHQLR